MLAWGKSIKVAQMLKIEAFRVPTTYNNILQMASEDKTFNE